ncbi:MAG: hypothetical protein A3B74_04890 [Candidatus Kerfeldbacteria bacterium RIFCSPHIGHO2_02_FULL_42_14]|uniref:RNA polymerase sigma-70 region 2 domain-containing protein n=1 Tax=Candidatus Kerfeldbacteria bacterium RIFCSPHIGHO2_02_FULL_42_14 TaxID=1798540 RepID=A0A1G2AP80_9BACT|nr:MAG: hypothetical protein A3B74_04890 [Candidatus Kerfeldbacteria bacterium RIFCSPHIGHO2_02_FULL_42_14]OGY81057.1 MAG: hypothetical protein A3E60_03610 [Candidatus Kerfeldbacteria bacterium RIFCSPHIGHO2_12_FULL_42_13]OGY84875.1 MAG: hypothetical protein A3I91_05255 [Candidatus Kerfeldbacteria bacterium RIFCSPLOWO2_02_FULL_42_19]OGY86788.1 MAG: hypothetical protein A3G01_02555 [Candidatus Kerfeldbacteria bacterium RIFCSPLOWO2_12_FULL_43_9]
MLEKQEEQSLVDLAKAGDQQAVIQLYKAYLPALCRFFYSHTGNTEDAKDLSQDTLIDAFVNILKFKGQARFKNWLYQIGKFKLADWWREKYKKPTISLEEFCPVIKNFDEFIDEDKNSGDTVKEAAVQKIMKMLPEKYRLVLEYRFLKNYSIKETALELNITEGNVKVIQFRALRKAALVSQAYEQQ